MDLTIPVCDGKIFASSAKAGNKDNSNNISYVDLRNGNAYVAYEIMQLFRGYKYAEKIDGEMSWWKV